MKLESEKKNEMEFVAPGTIAGGDANQHTVMVDSDESNSSKRGGWGSWTPEVSAGLAIATLSPYRSHNHRRTL